jgi:hypothetical protein
LDGRPTLGTSTPISASATQNQKKLNELVVVTKKFGENIKLVRLTFWEKEKKKE